MLNENDITSDRAMAQRAGGDAGATGRLVAALTLVLLLLAGCAGLPDDVQPVRGFEVERYQGKWYEIARLDHRFERGLSRVTAEYELQGRGALGVLNRGYDAREDTWKEAEGVARFVGSADVGQLKVSFFGPFYSGYNIIELDKRDYRYAMVAGNDRSYLWILSRTPQLDPAVQSRLLAQAGSLGFPVEQLLFVEHAPQ